MLVRGLGGYPGLEFVVIGGVAFLTRVFPAYQPITILVMDHAEASVFSPVFRMFSVFSGVPSSPEV